MTPESIRYLISLASGDENMILLLQLYLDDGDIVIPLKHKTIDQIKSAVSDFLYLSEIEIQDCSPIDRRNSFPAHYRIYNEVTGWLSGIDLGRNVISYQFKLIVQNWFED